MFAFDVNVIMKHCGRSLLTKLVFLCSFKSWNRVTVAVGDLPVFSDLLGDGKNPYNVPTVLIGLDVLSQRRVILESGEGSARRIFVAPK